MISGKIFNILRLSCRHLSSDTELYPEKEDTGFRNILIQSSHFPHLSKYGNPKKKKMYTFTLFPFSGYVGLGLQLKE